MLGYEKPARGRNEAPYPARNTKESQRTNRLEVEEHRRRRREEEGKAEQRLECKLLISLVDFKELRNKLLLDQCILIFSCKSVGDTYILTH